MERKMIRKKGNDLRFFHEEFMVQQQQRGSIIHA